MATKVTPELTDVLAPIVTDAVLSVQGEDKKNLDLHMVEIMTMQHGKASDTSLIKGLVLDTVPDTQTCHAESTMHTC